MLDKVSTYAQSLRKEGAGRFRAPQPADCVRRDVGDIQQAMNDLQAWRIIPRGAIVRMADAMRSPVLGFALETEEAGPEADDAQVDSNPVAPALVRRVVRTQIHGSVGRASVG